MRCPETWLHLTTTLWGLPAHQGKTFWYALVDARFTRAVALRRHILLALQMRVDLEHLRRQVVTPATVMAALEALYNEGQLRRSQTTHIEECILAQTDKCGRWQGDDAWQNEACQSSLPPDVALFA